MRESVMPKSEVLQVIVLIIAAFAGYLAVDSAAAEQVKNWLRQEIRKELPDAKSVSQPNHKPMMPSKGL
jgi:hypothetical protein